MNDFYYNEDKNFLKNHQISFLKNIIMGNSFPFYINFRSTKRDSNFFLSHQVKMRPENGGNWNSYWNDDFKDILNTYCQKNNIYYNEILRCSVNLTVKSKDKKCPIHKDHNYPHKQLLIYVNQPEDNKSYTILLKNKKIFKKIKPEQFKGVCFDNIEHYHYYPKKGHRLVLVYTFR